MNPVFLKHREKIDYSDYDGSDLVYPGEKKGTKDNKKKEDLDKNKKTTKPAVSQPSKAGAKGNADSKKTGKGDGANQGAGLGQGGKGAGADDKSGLNKGGAGAGTGTGDGRGSVGSNNGMGNGDKGGSPKGTGIGTGSPRGGASDQGMSPKKGIDINSPSLGDHSVKHAMTTDNAPTDTITENPSLYATGSATQRIQPRKYISPLKKLKSLEKSGPLKTVDFELAGKVLGNEFRTQITELANQSGVTGYVGRTNIGTIAGVLQGPSGAVDEMKQYIKSGGTDHVKIDRCVFTHEKSIDKMSLVVFIKFVEIIKRDPENNILTQPYREESPPKAQAKESPKKESPEPKKSEPAKQSSTKKK